jgi:hypothetical protein
VSLILVKIVYWTPSSRCRRSYGSTKQVLLHRNSSHINSVTKHIFSLTITSSYPSRFSAYNWASCFSFLKVIKTSWYFFWIRSCVALLCLPLTSSTLLLITVYSRWAISSYTRSTSIELMEFWLIWAFCNSQNLILGLIKVFQKVWVKISLYSIKKINSDVQTLVVQDLKSNTLNSD